jgi:hypothetical protein
VEDCEDEENSKTLLNAWKKKIEKVIFIAHVLTYFGLII